jgi:hypothetical protein
MTAHPASPATRSVYGAGHGAPVTQRSAALASAPTRVGVRPPRTGPGGGPRDVPRRVPTYRSSSGIWCLAVSRSNARMVGGSSCGRRWGNSRSVEPLGRCSRTLDPSAARADSVTYSVRGSHAWPRGESDAVSIQTAPDRTSPGRSRESRRTGYTTSNVSKPRMASIRNCIRLSGGNGTQASQPPFGHTRTSLPLILS